MKTGAVVVALGGLSLVMGCRSIVGIKDLDLDDGTDAQASDAGACVVTEAGVPNGPGSGWWSSCDPSTGCYTAGKPSHEDRPAQDDPGADVDGFYLALSEARLGSLNTEDKPEGRVWEGLGFDIDEACSSAPTCPSASRSSCQAPTSDGERDGLFCRDNAFGRLVYKLDTLVSPSDYYMNSYSIGCTLCAGGYNMILGISKYNGQLNDRSVRVDMFMSPGKLGPLSITDCSGTTWDKEKCWTSDDTFALDSAQVDGVDGGIALPSKLYDSTAFVRDGYLVVEWPENTLFWFVSGRGFPAALPLTVQKGLLVGKIEKVNGAWGLTDGVWGGRMKTTDLVKGLRQTGLCPGTSVYAMAEGMVNQAADVLGNGALLPDAPCDAVSLGIVFRATQTKVGTVEVSKPPAGCE